MYEKIFELLLTSFLLLLPIMVCSKAGIRAGINPYLAMFPMQLALFPLFENYGGIRGIIIRYLYLIPAVSGVLISGFLLKYAAAAVGVDVEKVGNVMFPKIERKGNAAQKISALLSGIFIPLVPLMVMRGMFSQISRHDPRLVFLEELGMMPFYFLPVYIGVSAARELRINQWLGGFIGITLINPLIIYIRPGESYQGTVFPMLLSIGFIYLLRKAASRFPMGSIKEIIIGVISIAVIFKYMGPFGIKVGNAVASSIIYIFNTMGIFSGIILGGLYSPLVATGLHQGIIVVETGLLNRLGYNFLLPIWCMADIAQGGAALGIAMKTKDKNKKKMAAIAGATSLWGLSEAAMFWVNLKYFYCFISGCIGAAVGATYLVYKKVIMTGMGLSGVPGLILVRHDKLIDFILASLIAFSVSFIFSMTVYKNEKTL